MVNRIVLNNISYHGKGAIQEIVNEVKTNGYQHLFVATDPDLLKFGVTAKVTDILDNAGIAYTVYSKIKPLLGHAVHLDRNDNRAGIDLIGFLLIHQLAFFFEALHRH